MACGEVKGRTRHELWSTGESGLDFIVLRLSLDSFMQVNGMI